MRALRPLLLLLLLLLIAPGPRGAGAAGPDVALPGGEAVEAVGGAWLSPVALRDPADPLSLARPQGLLVVLYSHGSRAEYRRDRCRPLDGTTPPVMRDLASRQAAGLSVAVFAFCTETLYGTFEAASGEGAPKMLLRAREIRALAARFVAAGVPPARIVLAGQSAGGWASLLAAAESQTPLGGVIAFAPAFAGKAEGRAPGWQRLRDAQAAVLSRRLSQRHGPAALVYAFPGDPYEPPDDLGFLAALPGVELRVGPGGTDCAPDEPHLSAFADCFRSLEGDRLLGFLAERAAPQGGS